MFLSQLSHRVCYLASPLRCIATRGSCSSKLFVGGISVDVLFNRFLINNVFNRYVCKWTHLVVLDNRMALGQKIVLVSNP